MLARLHQAKADGQIRDGADLDAVADALIGTLLLHALTHGVDAPRLAGLVDAVLNGIAQ